MTEDAKSFAFKAETKQLLNILIHSLYKDREIFLRELISNASDALNRVRFEILTDRNILDPEIELGIHISVDENNKIITVQDSGIGMTKDELVQNLGTIAQSGARAFLDATRDSDLSSDVIGQFGVGFYSVFMVAEWVRVTSRSSKPRAKAAYWYATGEDNYQVGSAQKDDRGTTIEIKLKEDAGEFASEARLGEIVKRHSDFVGFPIYIGENEEPTNKQTAIWRTPKQDLTTEKYNEFYRQLTLDFEEPLFNIHLVTDAPIQIYSILFIPRKAERGIFSLRKEDGLKLYSKNILIEEYSKDLLPEHFRFIQGVVDSEDLPLNVSRDTIQSTNMMAKLKKVVTGQVIKELENLAQNDQEKYELFWQEFGGYIKQGIATDNLERENLYSLLRFRTTKYTDSWSSLDEYIGRLQEDQKNIYYIVGEDSQSIVHSPHLDVFQAREIEVLLLSEPIDSFMVLGLRKYKEHELVNVTQADLEIPEEVTEDRDDGDAINDEQLNTIINAFKERLNEKVSEVRTTKKLSQSVARLVDPEGTINPEMQRVYKYLDKEFTIPKKILELNPSHPIIINLANLGKENELTKTIIDQIYDSALLVEGLHPNPAGMATRIQKIIEAALSN
jgi:molecular chaperone HtpG